MSDPFLRRQAKVAVVLAVSSAVALGLCGVQAAHGGIGNELFFFTGVLELAVIAASLIGLVAVGIRIAAHLLSHKTRKDDSGQ